MDVCTIKSSSVSMGWESSTSFIFWTILSLTCFRISSSNCSFSFTFSLSSSFFNSNFIGISVDAYFIGSYCGQLPTVRPKSIPRYKYLRALGVRVFANAVKFGLTCMSKIDGVFTPSVASRLSSCFCFLDHCFLQLEV